MCRSCKCMNRKAPRCLSFISAIQHVCHIEGGANEINVAFNTNIYGRRSDHHKQYGNTTHETPATIFSNDLPCWHAHLFLSVVTLLLEPSAVPGMEFFVSQLQKYGSMQNIFYSKSCGDDLLKKYPHHKIQKIIYLLYSLFRTFWISRSKRNIQSKKWTVKIPLTAVYILSYRHYKSKNSQYLRMRIWVHHTRNYLPLLQEDHVVILNWLGGPGITLQETFN